MTFSPRLLAISNQELEPGCLSALEKLCHEARPASVALVLRDRGLSESRRLEMGRRLSVACAQSGQRLIVAERLDLARLLDTGGVHLSAVGFLPSHARLLLGADAWISRAWHGHEQLSQEELSQLTAILISPVCAPRKGREALGVEAFAEQTKALSHRAPGVAVYALGGVSAANAWECLDAGATGVAVMGAILEPSERRALLRSLEILHCPDES